MCPYRFWVTRGSSWPMTTASLKMLTSPGSSAQLAKVCLLCGIPHKRHTFASWALADGAVNIWKLAKITGHDVEVTQKRYGHLMEGSLTDVARAIGAGLKRQQT
jgi:integrase